MRRLIQRHQDRRQSVRPIGLHNKVSVRVTHRPIVVVELRLIGEVTRVQALGLAAVFQVAARESGHIGVA